VFAHQIVDAQVLADALVRIGDYVAVQGLIGEGPYQAARDLLLIIAPRTGGEVLKEAGETNLAAAMRHSVDQRISYSAVPKPERARRAR
jgi:hypothetical protein